MNTWKVILATLVIFGAGVLTGGLLVSYSDRALRPALRRPAPEGPRAGLNAPNTNPNLPPAANRLPAPMPGPLRKDFLDRLETELSLSATQKVRIEQIITAGQERTRQAWQQIEPRMRRELIDTRGQIRAELTPEQQVRFEEMMRPQRPRDQRRPQMLRDRMMEGSPASNSSPGQN